MNIGTLSQSLNGNWVTFNEAKKQIRALCRKAGLKPVGFFRPRRENRGELLIHVDGGTVSARRKVNASVVFNKVVAKAASELDAETLAAILAQG